MQLIDTIFKDVRTIINSIVIKYENKAKEFETVDNRRRSDLYMSSAQNKDTYNTYQKFDLQAIMNSGITDIELAITYADDKKLIPKNRRDRVVIEQRKLIIAGYIEENNYYRMLNGKPNLEDVLFVYVAPEICTELGLDHNKPIHEFTTDEIIILNTKSYLIDIIAANPTKQYLNYLGFNSIDPIRSRNARNFAIIRMTKDVPDTFNEEFNTIYDQCREYFMSVIYNKNYGKQYDLYDNFISLMIMVMTIQRLISNTFKYGIEYDFYDLGSIKMIFDAYNVPFISNVPVDYQRILIRNLNNLLRYKSTDKVLYDICSLLGLETVKIYKYFLFKEHKFNDAGNPIFAYKEEDDGNGNIELVEDVDAMYKLFFQSVELKERNVALALSDTTNILDYTQVVVEDPYWWDEDSELKQAIYEGEFNFVESKYLSMNIMYKLTEMLFEISFIFNMLTDKKNELTITTIQLPKLFDEKEINLFDITALLCALISKKTNMVGNIITTPTKTLTVMGFNFSADFATIRANIANDKNVDKTTLLKYLQNLTISTPSDVNKLFVNIRELNDFLVDKLGSSQTLEEYHAYRKLYDTIMVTQHMESLFRKNDGSVAETYIEYLTDKDPTLSQFVIDIDPDLIGDAVEHILFRLNNLVTDLKYLNIVNDSNSVLLSAAITLIRFFKSYTTDLTSFNILYLLDSRYFNMIKLINKLQHINKSIQEIDTFLLKDYKSNAHYHGTITRKDLTTLEDLIGTSMGITLKELQNVTDKLNISQTSMNIFTDFNLQYASYISSLSKQILNKSSIQIQDKIVLQWEL